MGWGVLSGIGQGLTGFSSIMRETRLNDWENDKAELEFQRNKAIENLRASNNRQLSKEERADASKQWDKQFAAQNAQWQTQFDMESGRQADNKVVGKKDGIEVTKGEFNKMTPEEQAKVQSPEAYNQYLRQQDLQNTQDMSLDTTKKELELKQKVKKEEWDKMIADNPEMNTDYNRAAYFFGITPEKNVRVKPTDAQFEIAERIVAMDPTVDEDKLEAAEYAEIVRTTAYGLAIDDTSVLGSLASKVTDMPKEGFKELVDLAKRSAAAPKDKALAKEYQSKVDFTRRKLGDQKANDILKLVNETANIKQNETKKKEDTGTSVIDGAIKTAEDAKRNTESLAAKMLRWGGRGAADSFQSRVKQYMKDHPHSTKLVAELKVKREMESEKGSSPSTDFSSPGVYRANQN